MNEKIAEKWVKALRSGKYKQGKGMLCEISGNTSKYCCLGVLCHILNTPYEKKETEDGLKAKFYEKDFEDYLPSSILARTGIKDALGEYNLNKDNLAQLNDNGRSFKQIANVIEKHWKEL